MQESSIIDVWLGSKYTTEFDKIVTKLDQWYINLSIFDVIVIFINPTVHFWALNKTFGTKVTGPVTYGYIDLYSQKNYHLWSLLFKYISNFSSVELDKAYLMGKHVDLNNRLRISLTFYGNVWGSVYLP